MLGPRLSLALVLLVACNQDGNTTTSATESSSGTETTAGTTANSTGPVQPTTGGTSNGTSTSTGAATTDGTMSGTSTTGAPANMCGEYKNESECGLGGCDWTTVATYTHYSQGCQGDLEQFCVPKDPSGGITSVWREVDGEIEVVQFGFDPELGPDWHVCDCDGPLACLCTAAELDCPERLEDFCTTITSANGCTNAVVAGELVCAMFTVSQEGPLDGACDDPPWGDVCLPATGIGEKTCDPISLPYVMQGYCQNWTDPVYWRDNEGTIEVTTVCGPKPAGWNLCTATDPDQPGECKCGCKVG